MSTSFWSLPVLWHFVSTQQAVAKAPEVGPKQRVALRLTSAALHWPSVCPGPAGLAQEEQGLPPVAAGPLGCCKGQRRRKQGDRCDEAGGMQLREEQAVEAEPRATSSLSPQPGRESQTGVGPPKLTPKLLCTSPHFSRRWAPMSA